MKNISIIFFTIVLFASYSICIAQEEVIDNNFPRIEKFNIVYFSDKRVKFIVEFSNVSGGIEKATMNMKAYFLSENIHVIVGIPNLDFKSQYKYNVVNYRGDIKNGTLEIILTDFMSTELTEITYEIWVVDELGRESNKEKFIFEFGRKLSI